MQGCSGITGHNNEDQHCNGKDAHVCLDGGKSKLFTSPKTMNRLLRDIALYPRHTRSVSLEDYGVCRCVRMFVFVRKQPQLLPYRFFNLMHLIAFVRIELVRIE